MKIYIRKLLLMNLIFGFFSLSCFAANESKEDALALLNQFFNNQIIIQDHNIDKKQLPKPYDLLLTQPIMTLGLEKYYGHKARIEKISWFIKNNIYTRAITMKIDSLKNPIVEFALIKINLNELPQKVIDEIMNTDNPFGKILVMNHIKTSSHIGEFFSIKCNSVIEKYSHCALNSKIYGRVNSITNDHGKWLAQVIEILPSRELETEKAIDDLAKMHIDKVLIVIAMEEEAGPIIKLLQLKETHVFPKLPIRSFEGHLNKLKIFMLLNGLDPVYKVPNEGTQPATLVTYLGIKNFAPDLVISIGTAGGNPKNGANLKDLYVSQKIYFYDRRMYSTHYQYGIGGYTSANLQPALQKCNIPVKMGTICSGDSFDLNPTDARMIFRLSCDVIEMEAAGAAWAAMITKTPMVAIKGITDFYGRNTNHWRHKKNLPFVSKELAFTLKKILQCLNEH